MKTYGLTTEAIVYSVVVLFETQKSKFPKTARKRVQQPMLHDEDVQKYFFLTSSTSIVMQSSMKSSPYCGFNFARSSPTNACQCNANRLQ